MYSIDPVVLAVILGAVMPIINGFVMNQSWSSAVKANVGIVVGAVVSFLTTWQNDDGFAVFGPKSIALAIVQVVISIATYNGYYKKTINPNEVLPNVVPIRPKTKTETEYRKAA